MGGDLTAECQEHRKEIIMKKNIFTINFTEQTISGSKSALKKASNPASAEYKELTAKMALHPTFKVVEKEANPNKNTYKDMDFKFMQNYINAQPNAKELMAEYETIQKRSKIQKSPYQYVLSWFEGKFEGFNDLEQFKAKKEAERSASEAAEEND